MEKQINFKPNGFAQWARFFIDRYRVTILLIVVIVIAGYWGITEIPKQDFPDIPANLILVNAIYPGAASGDVEKDVIIPLENKINEVDGIKTLRSTAGNNYGNIFIELDDFKNLEQRVSEIEDKTGSADLPKDTEVQVQQVDVTGPTVAYVLSSEQRSRTELLELTPAVENYLKSASREIKTVEVLPGAEMEIRVALDESKLAQYHLTKETVVQAIQAATTTLPGGVVKTSDGREKPIVIKSPVDSLDSFKEIAVGPLKLSELARLDRVPVDDTFTIAGYVNGDGKAKSTEAIYLMVTKKNEGDVLLVSDAVKATVGEIHDKNIVPDDVELDLVFDTSPFVRSLIGDLVENGWQGLIIIMVVLLFFVSLRSGLLVALVLPISFLITWAMMPLLGYTLNIITLFAMILSLGMLVDNAIVIVSGMTDNLKRGMNKYAAALKSVQDYGAAILAATVTTVIALVPYAFLGGIIGEFIKYLPIVLGLMLVVSYFLAISISPLLGTWVLGKLPHRRNAKSVFKRWEKILVFPVLIFYAQYSVDWLVHRYYKMIRLLLKTKRGLILSVAVPVVLLVISFGYYLPRLSFVQLPAMDGEQMSLSVKFPAGTPPAAKNDVYRQIGEKILTIPSFESYLFWQDKFVIFITEPAARDSELTLQDIGERLDDQMEEFRVDDRIININTQLFGMPEDEYEVIVEIASSNQDGVTNLIDDLEKFVMDQENIDRVLNGPKDLLTPAVNVKLKEMPMAHRQSNAFFASQAVNSLFSEAEAGKVVVRDDGVSDKVTVVYQETARDSLSDVKNVQLSNNSSALPATQDSTGPTKLSEIASVEETDRLDTISRLDRERVGAFKVKLTEDGQAGDLEKKIKDYLTEDKLSAYGLETDDVVYGGAYASTFETANDLQVILIIALLSVYLVLVFQFNSYGEPFIIMLTIPLGLIGVFPALVWINSTLDIVSGLGIVALVGMVVNNAIVLIDYYNRVKRANPQLSLAQVLAETGRGRIKPILSTTITTIGGIIPLTINNPFWTGLGTTLIAGLLFATIGSLIVVPVLLYLFTKKKKRGLEKPWLKITALDDLTGQIEAQAEK